MDNTVVRELVDAGIHFGHRVGRWNPKMKPYIFCSRNSIHIINIKETLKGLLRSRRFITRAVASGKDVLFVGTKRQARQPVMDQANRCKMPYVIERWLGGTLTNFRTIRSRLGRLEELEEMDAKGLMAAESKKMESTLRREMRKIQRNLGGIRIMDRLPGVLIVIDARREHNAIAEAKAIVEAPSHYEAGKAVALTTVALLKQGDKDGTVRIEERELPFLDTIEATVLTMPREEEEFVRSMMAVVDETAFSPEDYDMRPVGEAV